MDSTRRCALVTGASAGIGAAFARRLARDGYDLVLVARREDRLRALADELERAHGTRSLVVAQDLGAPDAPQRVFAATEAAGLFVELLINNAGYGGYGLFDEQELEKQLGMVDVNCRALVGLSHMYARPMKAKRRGGILHLSSIVAFHPSPYMATYGATKGFILLFSEALWAELSHHGVAVTALCPGLTQTEFLDVSGLSGKGHAIETAESVVERGLAGLAARRPTVICGLFNAARAQIPRFSPRWLTARIAEFILGHW